MGGKGGGERPILFVATPSQDFVQCTSGEPTSRQSSVDRRDAEGQDPMRRRRWPLDQPNALMKLPQMGLFHIDHVPYLFWYSFFVNREIQAANP